MLTNLVGLMTYCAGTLCFFSNQVVAETVDMVECEAESQTDKDPQTDVVLHGEKQRVEIQG